MGRSGGKHIVGSRCDGDGVSPAFRRPHDDDLLSRRIPDPHFDPHERSTAFAIAPSIRPCCACAQASVLRRMRPTVILRSRIVVFTWDRIAACSTCRLRRLSERTRRVSWGAARGFACRRRFDLTRDLDLHVLERRELTVDPLESIRAARGFGPRVPSRQSRAGVDPRAARPRGRSACCSAWFASGVSVPRFGAGCRQPDIVMRSLRFGGSGCAVPGVGFPPLIGLPPICA
jgi:hypothetical protein